MLIIMMNYKLYKFINRNYLHFIVFQEFHNHKEMNY